VTAALGAAFAPSPSPAQPAPAPLDSVRVEGNSLTDTSLIRSTLALSPGEPLAALDVREGLRRLYALRLFSDLEAEVEPGPGGVVLVVRVVERPRITAVRFEGAKKISDEDLLEKVSSKVGSLLDRRSLEEDRRQILQAYAEEGYPRAEVAPLPKILDGAKADLIFRIEEGQKAKIRAITFTGNDAFEDGDLRGEMKTKVKAFLRGGGYNEKKLEEDLERVAAFYHNRGMKDARVADHSVVFSPDGRDVRIEIVVVEGPRYILGESRFEGSAAVREEALRDAVTYKAGDVYSAEKVDQSVANMYNLYTERGYLVALSIRPVTADRGQVVDVTYAIEEGDPSHIGEVRIVGNTRTKERVVRRELTVWPGDLFRRSALMRSQRDVFALGYFEDVQVDYDPPREGTDIDLVFRVKEKQTGTASAGAGYSSDAGLTGFLELGHNNLFGNGQSITLKLERGSRRSDYELAFNEPWLFGTPTSAGFEVFNTRRRRDLYDEVRRGGAVSVGRPLPGVDFTRVYGTYRLEDVKLSDFDSEEIADLFATGTRRTSSVRIALLRNSTDNPFYPSAGSKVTHSSEFAGGILGGDTDFQKHIVDQRYYFRPFWRPTLMLRIRTGVLTGYRAGASVPSYETFRLGGTTVDYLRGYDDYYVVPEENLRSSGGSVIRYPGGRYALTLSAEYQFLIVEPLHGLLFFDAGDTWNDLEDLDLTSLRRGAGFGIRLEIPLLGQIGFDYGYGFDRDGGTSGWRPHLILGRQF
jgi:outer membrane protein insertion porin family